MRRVVPAVALAAVLLSAPVARGTATVALSSAGALSATVTPVAGPDGGHGIVVEPFKDLARDGFRVRQDRGGRPAFTSSDSDCLVNPVFNDVVCNGSRVSISVTGGDGNDVVAALEGPTDDVVIAIGGLSLSIPLSSGVGSFSCIPLAVQANGTLASPPQGTFTANLGGGGDVLGLVPQTLCPGGSFPENTRAWRLDVQGGGGADGIGLGPRNDILRGGAQNDVLLGDVGDDLLEGGTEADQLNGGGGVDSASYENRSIGVTVRLGVAGADDGSSDDGPAGQRDTLTSIERVLGGSGNDNLQGDGGENTLVGNNGPDIVGGGGGVDSVNGGAGIDALNGGPDPDILRGGADNDNLNARDGVRDDFISCGPGDDVALIDLEDVLNASTAVPGRIIPSSCERVEEAPVDDGPPGRALKQRLRARRGGKVVVKVACPRRARVACRGVLTLRHPRSRRVLARGRYRLRLGEKDAVSLTARRRLPRRVVAEMKEQGMSRKGPRSSSQLLAVAR